MAERFTRDALYELVWSEPVATLAARFGISGVALKKICAKAHIPVPPRGYWARLNAGKRTHARIPLPPRAPGMDEIVGVGVSRYGYVGLTDEEILGPIPDPPSFGEPIEALRERARQTIGRVSVARTLSSPHPAIARLLKEDERRREHVGTSPYASSWDQPVFDNPAGQRRLRLLNALFTAIARVDGKARVDGTDAQRVIVTIFQQYVYLRVDSVPERTTATRRGEVSPPPSTRNLRISILSTGADATERMGWEDGLHRLLESCIVEIATEVATQAEMNYRATCLHRHKWRIERKAEREEEIRIRRAKAEREERERQEAAAKARVERLLTQAALLRQANDIRAFVEAACAAMGELSSEVDTEAVTTWRVWALAEADRIDPVVSRAFLVDVRPETGP